MVVLPAIVKREVSARTAPLVCTLMIASLNPSLFSSVYLIEMIFHSRCSAHRQRNRVRAIDLGHIERGRALQADFERSFLQRHDIWSVVCP